MAEEGSKENSLIDLSVPAEVSIPVDFSPKQLVKIGFGLGAGFFFWALLLLIIALIGANFIL